MNFGCMRGSIGDNRRLGWVLGVAIFLLLILEPESWFITKPAKASESESTPQPAAKPTTKPATTTTTAATAKPAATTPSRPQIYWNELYQPSSPLPKRRGKRQALRRVIASLKRKIA